MILRRVFLVAALVSALAGCGAAVGGAAAVGVAASKEKGLSGSASDTVLAAEINHHLLQHDEALFRKVNLSLSEGRVLMTGVVPTQELRDTATRLAWKADGVREVINELQVGDADAFDFGRDVWFANKLRTTLLFDKEVRNINYQVDAVNGVIYLIGLARDQAELDRVLNHARNIDGVKKVVSYVMLRDDPRRFEP